MDVRIADLPGSGLGLEAADLILIDATAAGFGWDVGSSVAIVGGRAINDRIDLLTVLMHEYGHVLGMADDDFDDLMGETLAPGVRRLPTTDAVLTGLSYPRGPINSPIGRIAVSPSVPIAPAIHVPSSLAAPRQDPAHRAWATDAALVDLYRHHAVESARFASGLGLPASRRRFRPNNR